MTPPRLSGWLAGFCTTRIAINGERSSAEAREPLGQAHWGKPTGASPLGQAQWGEFQ